LNALKFSGSNGRWRVAGLSFFRADFPAKLRGAMFDGLYLRNLQFDTEHTV